MKKEIQRQEKNPTVYNQDYVSGLKNGWTKIYSVSLFTTWREDVAELLGEFLLSFPPSSSENESNLSSICSVGSLRAQAVTMALWNKTLFLLLIAATCVVGKSPLPAPLALEHVQNRPHSHWMSNSQQQTYSNCKEWSPWLESRWGCARTLCSRWRTASAFTFQDWLKVVTGHVKMAKWGHSALRM